jgi:hypothetical protein
MYPNKLKRRFIILLTGILMAAGCFVTGKHMSAYRRANFTKRSSVAPITRQQIQEMDQHMADNAVSDAIKEYEAARLGTDKSQIYVKAGAVTAAYMDANDQNNYLKWRDIEKQAAVEAGIAQ